MASDVGGDSSAPNVCIAASAPDLGREASAPAGDPPDPPLASFAPRSPRVLPHATPSDAATRIDTYQGTDRIVTPARFSILAIESIARAPGGKASGSHRSLRARPTGDEMTGGTHARWP
jgi:hypothetical protein